MRKTWALIPLAIAFVGLVSCSSPDLSPVANVTLEAEPYQREAFVQKVREFSDRNALTFKSETSNLRSYDMLVFHMEDAQTLIVGRNSEAAGRFEVSFYDKPSNGDGAARGERLATAFSEAFTDAAQPAAPE